MSNRFRFTPSCGCGCREECTCDLVRVGVEEWTDDTFPNVRQIQGSSLQWGSFNAFGVTPGAGGTSLGRYYSLAIVARTGFDESTRRPKVYNGDQTGRLASDYVGNTLCDIYSSFVSTRQRKFYVWTKCRAPNGTCPSSQWWYDYDYKIYTFTGLSSLFESSHSYIKSWEITGGIVGYIRYVNYRDGTRFNPETPYKPYTDPEQQQAATEKAIEAYNNNTIKSTTFYIQFTDLVAHFVYKSKLQEIIDEAQSSRTGPSFGDYVDRVFYIKRRNVSIGSSASGICRLVLKGNSTTYLDIQHDRTAIDGNTVDFSGETSYSIDDSGVSYEVEEYFTQQSAQCASEIIRVESTTVDDVSVFDSSRIKFYFSDTLDTGLSGEYAELYTK